jgi:predicted enzyme related to lactoylglutathione lyase
MSKFETNAVTWFEIPTADFQRATKFYEEVLDVKLLAYPGPEPCNIFPVPQGGVSGCIVQRAGSEPGKLGTTVYLNVDGKMDASIKRAEKLSATITVPRTAIDGGFGYYACLIDSEGNYVGLHTREF